MISICESVVSDLDELMHIPAAWVSRKWTHIEMCALVYGWIKNQAAHLSCPAVSQSWRWTLKVFPVVVPLDAVYTCR